MPSKLIIAIIAFVLCMAAVEAKEQPSQIAVAVWGQGCYTMEKAVVWAPVKNGVPDTKQVHVDHIKLDNRPECWTYEIRRTK